MEERKFKTNDYVVVKNWDELVEEYGLVDPESVREQMRNDEDCYWSEEEINEYNPEIINVPWGARKAMIDELVTMGLMKVKEYGEDGSVQLESDTYIDSIIPEEILQPVSEDEVKNYIFWLNKKDDDFVMQDYDFARTNGLLSYVGLVNGSIDFIGGDRGNELIAYFYAASILRSIDFNEGVTEYLSHCHEVGFHAFDHFYTDRKSHLQVVAIKDVSEDREEELVNMWAERGCEEVEFHHDKVFKVFTHPEQKGTTIFLKGEKEDYKKDFEAYELIMQIVSHVYGDTMQDVLEVVSNRDRSEAMNMIRDIFSEADKRYVKIKNKINIENFLKVASKGQQKYLEREVQNNQDRVNSYKDNLRHSLKTLRESQERLFGYLHMKDDSQFNEVREMLNMMGDDLSDFRCDPSGDWFSFAIVQPLLYWDDDIYERNFDDEYFEEEAEYEKTKKVFDKIFKTREYTLYLQQAIMIDLVNNRPVAMRDYNYTNDMYIPNPHFHEFNCWGANEANLIEAISNRDYMSIFNLVRSAVAGISLYDTSVVGAFFNYCEDRFTNKKCLKVPGREEFISFKEARALED